jgi:Lipase (class 3)
MSLPLNCVLLCASGAAYDIDPATGRYTPDSVFSKAVGYSTTPTPISADTINACLVGQNANGIIVAFRGTLPPQDPDSYLDWLQDLFVRPLACQGLPGEVHEGFLDAVNSILPQVVSTVNSLQPSATNPVYVTGHSKGGGMAPIAAYLMQQGSAIPIKQIVTFAAPKPGDQGFQTGYQSVFKNHLRYENYGDLVPLLPPADEFIGLLAKAALYIPEIGTQLSKLISEAAGWDYLPVGAELFVESASNNYRINTNELAIEQVFDFTWNLGQNLGNWVTTLENAHSLGCGNGYMSGTCPSSVCEVSSIAV